MNKILGLVIFSFVWITVGISSKITFVGDSKAFLDVKFYYDNFNYLKIDETPLKIINKRLLKVDSKIVYFKYYPSIFRPLKYTIIKLIRRGKHIVFLLSKTSQAKDIQQAISWEPLRRERLYPIKKSMDKYLFLRDLENLEDISGELIKEIYLDKYKNSNVLYISFPYQPSFLFLSSFLTHNRSFIPPKEIFLSLKDFWKNLNNFLLGKEVIGNIRYNRFIYSGCALYIRGDTSIFPSKVLVEIEGLDGTLYKRECLNVERFNNVFRFRKKIYLPLLVEAPYRVKYFIKKANTLLHAGRFYFFSKSNIFIRIKLKKKYLPFLSPNIIKIEIVNKKDVPLRGDMEVIIKDDTSVYLVKKEKVLIDEKYTTEIKWYIPYYSTAWEKLRVCVRVKADNCFLVKENYFYGYNSSPFYYICKAPSEDVLPYPFIFQLFHLKINTLYGNSLTIAIPFFKILSLFLPLSSNLKIYSDPLIRMIFVENAVSDTSKKQFPFNSSSLKKKYPYLSIAYNPFNRKVSNHSFSDIGIIDMRENFPLYELWCIRLKRNRRYILGISNYKNILENFQRSLFLGVNGMIIKDYHHLVNTLPQDYRIYTIRRKIIPFNNGGLYILKSHSKLEEKDFKIFSTLYCGGINVAPIVNNTFSTYKYVIIVSQGKLNKEKLRIIKKIASAVSYVIVVPKKGKVGNVCGDTITVKYNLTNKTLMCEEVKRIDNKKIYSLFEYYPIKSHTGTVIYYYKDKTPAVIMFRKNIFYINSHGFSFKLLHDLLQDYLQVESSNNISDLYSKVLFQKGRFFGKKVLLFYNFSHSSLTLKMCRSNKRWYNLQTKKIVKEIFILPPHKTVILLPLLNIDLRSMKFLESLLFISLSKPWPVVIEIKRDKETVYKKAIYMWKKEYSISLPFLSEASKKYNFFIKDGIYYRTLTSFMH